MNLIKSFIFVLLLTPMVIFANGAEAINKGEVASSFPELNEVQIEQVYQRMLYDKVSLADSVAVSKIVSEVKGLNESDLVQVFVDTVQVIRNSEREFALSFDIKNTGSPVGGLKYRIGVQSVGDNLDDIYWTTNPSSEFAVTETNSKKVREVVVLPSFVSGDVLFKIQIGDNTGKVIATKYVDNHGLNIASLTNVVVGDCRLIVDGGEFFLSQGVDIAKDESVLLRCNFENKSDSQLTITPTFSTHLRNSWGESVGETAKGEEINLKARFNDIIDITIPVESVPQAYDTIVSLVSETELVADVIPVHYVIQGESATIQELVAEKVSYKSGETANLSLSWTGRVDSFEGSRANEDADSLATVVYANIDIRNSAGQICGSLSNIELKQEAIDLVSRQFFKVPVSIDCEGLKLSAVLKNSNGDVLFEHKTDLSKVDDNGVGVVSAVATDNDSTREILLVLGLAIAGIVSMILYFRKANNKIIASFIFIFIVSWSALLPIMSASAEYIKYSIWHAAAGAWNHRHSLDLYFTGPTGTNLTYRTTDTITVGSWIQNATCSNSLIRGYFQAVGYKDGVEFYNNTYNDLTEKSSFSRSFTNLQPGNYKIDVTWDDAGCTRITGYNNKRPPEPKYQGYCNVSPRRTTSYYFTVLQQDANGSCSAVANTCTTGTVTNQSTNSGQYIWTCAGTGAGTSASCSAYISPTLTLNANPGSVPPNGSSNLTWTVTDATSCSAGGAWSGSKNASGGTESVSPNQTSSYTLTCTGPGGSVSRSATVRTPSGSISATGCSIPVNGTSCDSTVRWNSSDFLGSAAILQGGTRISTTANNPGGTIYSITPSNRTFKLDDTGSSFERTAIASAECASGGVWAASLNRCVYLPEVDIVVKPEVVRSGSTAEVVVTVDSTYDLVCTLNGGMNRTINHSGSATMATYTATTNPLTAAQIIEAVCTSATIPEVTDMAEGRVDVIPVIEEI